ARRSSDLHRGAEFGGGVDGAQQVVEVVPGYGRVGVDHAAPDGGDRGQAEPVLLEGAGQFGQPAGGQVARAQPAVGEVDVVEALGGDLAEDPGPLRGGGVLGGEAARGGGGELQECGADRPVLR